jgi:hypothetical protein
MFSDASDYAAAEVPRVSEPRYKHLQSEKTLESEGQPQAWPLHWDHLRKVT